MANLSRMHVNNWYTVLDGAITDVDTTMTIIDPPAWEDDAPIPFYAVLRDLDSPLAVVEIILVTDLVGFVATIVRGQEGTTAQNWPDATLVRSTISAGSLDRLVASARLEDIGYVMAAHYSLVGTAPNRANATAYDVGDLIKVPSAADPLYAWYCIKPGTSDAAPPDYDSGSPVFDGTAIFADVRLWGADDYIEHSDYVQPSTPTGEVWRATHEGRMGPQEPFWASGVTEMRDPVMVQVFTATGVWTPQPRGSTSHIICIGGGGPGGSGRKGAAGTARVGGGPGGGGGYSEETFHATDLTSITGYDVIVGTGGTGAAAQATNSTDGNTGSAGTASYVTEVGDTEANSIIHAGGGGPGVGGQQGAGGTGGAGGLGTFPGGVGDTASATGAAGAASARQTTRTAGGAPGGGITAADAATAGGGGNTPSSSARTGATAGAVNSAGAAGTNPIATADNSPVPGGSGAGGGGSTSGNGGAGGNGAIGAGGGGGGAALNGVGNSGAGGNGGPGIVIIITV